jgi:predicted  nucleic acid-binding Zn-ribbon protein
VDEIETKNLAKNRRANNPFLGENWAKIRGISRDCRCASLPVPISRPASKWPREAGVAFHRGGGINGRAMRHPALDHLLILQDRDQRRLNLEAQLAAGPDEIAAVERKIAAERAAIEAARVGLQQLEVQKKSLENDIGSAEAKLAKYRTQQSQVRKNDEFQALGHEIDNATKEVGELEGRELEVMYAIDEAKKMFATTETELKASITGHEARIRDLRARDINLRAELTEAQAATAAARAPLDALALRLYDRVATRTRPVCAPVHGGKCGGCHLRISGEADADSRKGDKLATCDQCGRIIWWEAV